MERHSKDKQLIAAILERTDTKISYFPSQKEFTVAQLQQDVNRFCEKTRHIDSIFLAAPNSYEWLVVYFACVLGEKTLYTADFQLQDAEIERRLAICKPDVVIVSGGRQLTCQSVLVCDILSDDGKMGSGHGGQAQGFRFVQFTSGTTGNAKGVVMRDRHIAANILGMQELCRFEPSDRFLLASAMSHPMGHIFMLLTLRYAQRLILTESPLFFPQAILSSDASMMVVPPVMLTSFKAHPEMVQKLSKFRYILVAGAPLDEATYAFYQAANVHILNGYGMTECVSGIAMGEPDSTAKLTPLSNCRIRIAEDGEVLVQGACVCEQYLSGDSITTNGWYHTKDLGEFRQNKLVITGRKDNLVVLRNGYKIALEPMEAKINGVEGVLDCVVRVLRNDDADVICCDVVPSNDCVLTGEELKKRINLALNFYERIDRIELCQKLALRGGKKERK